MEEVKKKSKEKKKIGVDATILLTIAAALGVVAVIGIVYAIFTMF